MSFFTLFLSTTTTLLTFFIISTIITNPLHERLERAIEEYNNIQRNQRNRRNRPNEEVDEDGNVWEDIIENEEKED
jgi:hypothetical protein